MSSKAVSTSPDKWLRGLYRATARQSVTVGYVTCWNGPYGGGGDGLISAGTELLFHWPIPDKASAITASLVQYHALETSLIPQEDVQSRRYRGYYLVVDVDVLLTMFDLELCLPLNPEHLNWPEVNHTPSQIAGCLLGSAFGDAVGLNYEGLSAKRMQRYADTISRRGLLLGKRFFSDDTEHHTLTSLSLLASRGDLSRFTSQMGWRLRKWFLALPPATGMATLRACIKLCLGFPARFSGVYSAGNGPMMRAGVLGVCLGKRPDELMAWVRANSCITHSDPLATYCAYAVALACYVSASNCTPQTYYQLLANQLPVDDASNNLLEQVARVVAAETYQQAEADFLHAESLEKGVTGYSVHTLKAVLHVWWRYGDRPAQAIEHMIAMGGDTDTSAAILGAILGAKSGREAFPDSWRRSLCDWPLSRARLERIADTLADRFATQTGAPDKANPAPRYPPYLLLLVRNLLFMVLVLAHGLKRLIPGL